MFDGIPLTARLRGIAPVQQPIPVPFGPWRPDLSELGEHCTEAKNVVPTADGFNPLPSLFVQSDAMDARCQGAFIASDATGGIKLYAGNASKLYEVTSSGTTMTDRSVMGGYSTSSDSTWRFTEWKSDTAGADLIVATNYDDEVQQATVGGGSAFANMITSTLKPNARDVMVVGQFLVLMNTNDGTDGVRPTRAWWCGIRDETDYDPDLATQCDFEDLRWGGPIQRGVGGEYGLIFSLNAITRMTYVGSPLVFRFDRIAWHGTQFANSVANWGRRVFYYGPEGFMQHDGLQAVPIGNEKVDRYFDEDADITDRTRFYGAVDPTKTIYVLAYPGQGNASQQPNKLLIFNYMTGEWSRAEVDVDVIFMSQTQGLTLEELDTVSSSIDDLPESLDHSRWLGGQYKFAAIDSSQKYAEFDGANLAAVLETNTRQLIPGRKTYVRKVRPIVDLGTGGTPTITAAVAGRQKLIESETFGSAASEDGVGEFALHKKDRYHKFRMNIASGGSWKQARGFEVLGRASSRR